MNKERSDGQVNTLDEVQNQKIMEKFDTESRYRNLNIRWMVQLSYTIISWFGTISSYYFFYRTLYYITT